MNRKELFNELIDQNPYLIDFARFFLENLLRDPDLPGNTDQITR